MTEVRLCVGQFNKRNFIIRVGLRAAEQIDTFR